MDTHLPEARPTPSALTDSQEIDVWWGGYAGRTGFPGLILCGLLTALIIGVAWSLGAWHGSTAVRYATHVCTGALWIWQVGRVGYRVMTTNYRLTTRRLFCDRGFHHPGSPGIELANIAQVVVERGPLERLVGIGRIRVVMRASPVQTLVLEGIRDPEHVAREIRRRMQQVGSRSR